MDIRIVTPEQFEEGYSVFAPATGTMLKHIPYREVGRTASGNVIVKEPKLEVLHPMAPEAKTGEVS